MLRRLRAFTRDDRGGAALEFALVAAPFIFMIFAVFEYALVYLVTVSLDSAVIQTARQIRTGEAQKQTGGPMTSDQFKTQVCNHMGWLTSPCGSSLYVDARTFSTFASESSPQPVTNGAFDPTKLQFNMGGSGDIVLVTCFYQWQLLTPALQSGLSSMSGGIAVITSRAAFRNEPY